MANKNKRSLEDGYDAYNPAPFVENNPSFKYYTDNINPIYVDNNTGEVWQNNKPRGSVILPDVEVKGKNLKAIEAGRNIKQEKGLELSDPEFELMTLGLGSLAKRGIKTGIKALYNKYPYSPFIPLNPNRYYRIVGPKDAISGDAIADAINTGYLRTSSLANAFKVNPDPNTITLAPKVFDYMMFAKGAPWKGSLAAVGGKGSPRIIRSKADIDNVIWEQSNIDFRHKGHKGIFRPRYNGSLEQIPAEYFEYFEKGTGPISKYFWKRHDFK